MGRITTHVLDTAHGKPGQDIAVTLYAVQGEQRILQSTACTNADGRCDQPLLEGSLTVGIYELDFVVGAYFAQFNVDISTLPMLPTPNFLDRITLRFGVADAAAHYHVPLLVTPWSYSTYRGS
jgi:5-hydroxyisourate hydrolase